MFMAAKPLPSLPMGPVRTLVGPPRRPDTQLFGRGPTNPLTNPLCFFGFFPHQGRMTSPNAICNTTVSLPSTLRTYIVHEAPSYTCFRLEDMWAKVGGTLFVLFRPL